MLRFQQFLKRKEDIDEGVIDFVKNLITKAKSSLIKLTNKLLNKLGFGQSVSIPIDFVPVRLDEAKEEKPDLKSRMGFYSERVTAVELAKLIKKNKLNLTSSVSALSKELQQYKKNKLLIPEFKADDVVKEIKRMDESGIALAESIFSDMSAKVKDLALVDFQVILTGESAKFESKADLRLVATKHNSSKVVETIDASLKAYKGWSINVANKTFVSWVQTLLAPDIKGSGQKFIDEFVKRHEKIAKKFPEAKAMAKIFSDEKAKQKKLGNRKDASTIATAAVNKAGGFVFIRNFMVHVFNELYKGKNKKVINERFLELMGLDGADAIYIAVKTKNKVETLSSETSEEFKKMVDKLQEGFIVNFDFKKDTPTTMVQLLSKKKVLLQFSMGFKEAGTIVSFLNFSQFK